MMDQVNSFVQTMGDHLGDLANSDLVVGEPMVFGEITVVPLTRLSVAVAGGGGSGSGDMEGHRRHAGPNRGKGKGTGGGSGGGVQIRPVALAVFKPDGVEILSIPERTGKVEKFLDTIPGFVDKLKLKFDKNSTHCKDDKCA